MNGPQIGDVRMHRDQRYALLRVEPYTRKSDGAVVDLLVWSTACWICGAAFECTTGSSFKPTRNCPAHRGRVRWRDRVQETEPAMAAHPLPDGRPIAPVSAYERDR